MTLIKNTITTSSQRMRRAALSLFSSERVGTSASSYVRKRLSFRKISQVSVIFMAKVQYVSSSAELPTDRQYILVEYGDENRLVRHGRGITMTVDRSMPVNLLEAHAETVIGDAQSMADQENIDTVYVTVPRRS